MKYASKLPESLVNWAKDKTPPWGPVGYVTYKRTYSRLTDRGETEEWHQTVARDCQGLIDIGGVFTHNEIRTLYEYVFNLKMCFSGRSLWQLGTKAVQRIGSDSLQNCWHVSVNELNAFCFTFNQLMLGGGVGFNIEPEQVYSLPTVKHGVAIVRSDSFDVDFIVPDNREGWVDLLRRVLNAFFVTGKNLTYSTNCIRHKGRAIATFGGTASGPEELVKGINEIVAIIGGRLNNKLRPIDCLDIMNIIGKIVVSGNVRRSAELAAGSMEDKLFLSAKNWGAGPIPNWRGMSNNSVICNDFNSLPEEFWSGYNGSGEPYGLLNLDLARSHGRLEDGLDYRPDYGVTGTNPCAEIFLEPYEPCNLFELFLPNLHSKDEFITAGVLGYKVCKAISKYPFSDPKINEVVHRNHRLGVGATGILQSKWVRDPTSFDTVYNAMEETDISYSRELGVGRSIKLTAVKPSGTLSLLAGCTSGVHPAFSRHYTRRIRFSSEDPLVDMCRSKGYHVEPSLNQDGTRDLGAMIVSFPIKTPQGTVLAKKTSAIDQLKFQALMQQHWSDNAVSITCYYKPEELPEIKSYLKENYNESIKSVSFLLHTGHGFTQAPLEEITEKDFQAAIAACEPIEPVKDTVERELDPNNLECAGGACPVR